ncbi:MAG: peptidylprolyl isomerase [Phycisphaeraceae bacterium]
MTDNTYPQVQLETSAGPMTLELWNDVAPQHAESFLKLVDKGFYDGLTFHRIIPGFVVQGGCPRGDGTGGPGWNVPAEFNDREHHKGVLSMARSADPDSAGSQFFICLTREHCQHLDGQYTAFGRVIEGLDAVDHLADTPLADARAGQPAEPPVIQSAKRVQVQ